MTTLRFILPLVAALASGVAASASPRPETLSEAGFRNPPLSARPGAFWPWLNGTVSLERITRELEEMKDKGMSGADIWDVRAVTDPGQQVPAGPAFLGEESLEAIRHAVQQADRLGLRLGMIAASGWNAGGTWMTPPDSGMGLFHSELAVAGPQALAQELPFPEVPALCPKDASGRPVFFKEVAVLAVPVIETPKRVPQAAVVRLTERLDASGRLTWEVPAGRWVILRFIMTNTGHPLVVPSPHSEGPMIDFLNPDATRFHFQHILDRLESKLGKLGGTSLKYLEVDSMELGDETAWTARLPAEFSRQHGYDTLPYLPVLKGWTVESEDITRRFLYDWRKTVSDVFIENHYRAGQRLLHQHGLELCAEAGGPGAPVWSSCPVEALKALGAVDILRGEFWPKHRNLRVIKGVASAAHIYGKTIVDAEAFTSWRHWQDGPYFHKQLADIALAEGLNHFTFHTFTHSPEAAGLPGLAYHAGTHINPNEVWWPMARPFIDYLSRCSHLLQQGLFVADVCYYYGDKAPNFVSSKHMGFSPGAGYDYDVVNSDVLLHRMNVKNGRLVLPDGMSYALLVLPDQADMDLEVLRKIAALVKAGATVVGPKPSRTGTLADYPRRDAQVVALANQVWGPCDGAQVREHAHGKGRIVWNRSLPKLLRNAGIPEDFSYQGADGRTRLDYLHRRTAGADLYFVCNLNERWEDVACMFRVQGKQPELWHPETGEIRPLPAYETVEGRTRLRLHLAPAESVFVVFRRPAAAVHYTRLEFMSDSSLPRMRPHLLAHAATPAGPLWLSDGKHGPEHQQITFDLAAVRDLRAIRLWNYNDHARGNLNYGVKDFTLEVSADNVTYRALGRFALHAAPENEERAYAQDIEAAAAAVRYVRLAIQSNQNNPGYLDGISPFVGLSKAAFFAPEEIAGVRVASVSSGAAFDPGTDGGLGLLHPPAALRLDAAGRPCLQVWEPGTHTLFDSRGRSRQFEVPSLPEPWTVEGAWTVHFPRGWGAPDSKVFDRLMSWTEAAEDGIRHFSGRAVYRKTFELPPGRLEAGATVELDLGVVQQVARVTLNGRALGVLWKPPYLVDVTGVAVAGRNELVVEVANTWANRIAGDAGLPPERQYCRSNILPAPAAQGRPLQPSGLIGPVRILQARNLDVP